MSDASWGLPLGIGAFVFTGEILEDPSHEFLVILFYLLPAVGIAKLTHDWGRRLLHRGRAEGIAASTDDKRHGER